MNEIGTAFSRALEENPKSVIAQSVSAEMIRLKEERRFFWLREQFKGYGHKWFGT
jgi:hypothetical protein